MYKERLKSLRERSGATQKVVAQSLGIVGDRYGQYEREYEIIPIKHLNECCNFFDVSIDYIFGFTNNKKYIKSKKDIDKNISGKRLKELRKSLKYSQTEFANILKNSYGTISGYEKGRYIIATPFLYTLCKKYHISADYLLGKIDNMPNID